MMHGQKNIKFDIDVLYKKLPSKGEYREIMFSSFYMFLANCACKCKGTSTGTSHSC
jgi:hypothetical protein